EGRRFLMRRPDECGFNRRMERLHYAARGCRLPWNGRGVDGGAMFGVNLKREGLLFFVAHDRDLYRLAHVGAEITVPVGGGVDGIGANFENHVECLESSG